MRRMLPKGAQSVLVAASGGPDSQALLDILGANRKSLNIQRLLAAGIDHGLRPEAPNELRHAEALARKHGVGWVTRRVTLQTSGNLMNNARNGRYEALRSLALRNDASHIILGHTASDQAETVLARLARGTSLRGIAAMRPIRDNLLRPMLGVQRGEVLKYLTARDIAFARDPSNQDHRFERIKIRKTLVPLLESLNLGAQGAICRFAELAGQDDDYLQSLARTELEKRLGPLDSLALQNLHDLPSSIGRRVIAGWLDHHGLQVDSTRIAGLITDLRTPNYTGSWGRRVMRTQDGRLWLDGAPRAPEVELFEENLYPQPQLGFGVRTRLLHSIGSEHKKSDIQGVAFDADRLHLGLRMRPWQAGDKIRPFGSTGSIKVGDLFTNAKVPRALRTHWPLVLHGKEVVWVVGMRRGSLAPVHSSSQRVFALDIEGALPFST